MKLRIYNCFIIFSCFAFPICLFVQQSSAASQQETAKQSIQPASVEAAELGGTKNVHRVGNLFLAGQFEKEDIEAIKQAGIGRVITLRTDKEVDWNEKELVESAGLRFDAIGFLAPESLTDEIFDQVRMQLKNENGKTLLHCGSAGRVGAVWLVHRVLVDNVPIEQARHEAHKVGLKTPGYEERAIAYIRKQQATADAATKSEKSVRAGINDSFMADDLNPEEWIKRFEIESREIYAARREVLKACGIQQGWQIADIGAGTGLYTRLFANETGSKGWVYAVDISPRLVQHIAAESKIRNQKNVTGVICPEDSISLPPNTIDFAFICDTYHHFEFPRSTLASIQSALKPGGQIVVIDFKRVEGQSRPWVVEHVRAGQEVFQAEIESAGFEFVGEIEIPGFAENYFLKFKKSSSAND